jgi:hypothetical protein
MLLRTLKAKKNEDESGMKNRKKRENEKKNGE